MAKSSTTLSMEEAKGQIFYRKSSSAFKLKVHCPICGGKAEKFATSFYCEQCDIDFDEHGKIL